VADRCTPNPGPATRRSVDHVPGRACRRTASVAEREGLRHCPAPSTRRRGRSARTRPARRAPRRSGRQDLLAVRRGSQPAVLGDSRVDVGVHDRGSGAKLDSPVTRCRTARRGRHRSPLHRGHGVTVPACRASRRCCGAVRNAPRAIRWSHRSTGQLASTFSSLGAGVIRPPPRRAPAPRGRRSPPARGSACRRAVVGGSRAASSPAARKKKCLLLQHVLGMVHKPGRGGGGAGGKLRDPPGCRSGQLTSMLWLGDRSGDAGDAAPGGVVPISASCCPVMAHRDRVQVGVAIGVTRFVDPTLVPCRRRPCVACAYRWRVPAPYSCDRMCRTVVESSSGLYAGRICAGNAEYRLRSPARASAQDCARSPRSARWRCAVRRGGGRGGVGWRAGTGRSGLGWSS